MLARGFWLLQSPLAAYQVFPGVHYYGFPTDMIMFGGFFTFCLWRWSWAGFWLSSFTYSVWELIDVIYTNPFEEIYLLIMLVSLWEMRGFWKPPFKALSFALSYRLATAAWAWQVPFHDCGYAVCGDPFLFVAGQVAYTLVVFAFALEGVRGGFLSQQVRKRLPGVLEKYVTSLFSGLGAS